jgi:serine/threonine protein kinase
MKVPFSSRRQETNPSGSGSHESRTSSDDCPIAKALEEYLERCDAGRPPDHESFLAAHAEIADALKLAMDGLDFVNRFGPHLQEHSESTSGSATRSAAQHVPHCLGDFRIIRELGRGGMGVVYEAEQLSLGRSVALKVLPYAAMLDERHLQRFRNEARAAATLSHPNIVPVHFVGADRSVHFYAMQLIDGQSLAHMIAKLRTDLDDSGASPTAESGKLSLDQGSLPRVFTADTQPIAELSTQYSASPKHYFRRVAELGMQIAQALAHAHNSGIVHRDVKPANVLLDKEGKAWITDFGLARIETDGNITLSGDFLGTLRYMSPEQARGDRHVVDHRTDIFSLGATLYEVVTLRPAFDGQNREQLFNQISFEAVRSPRSANPAVPHELETILLKAMEKDPVDRFASAGEFADDLQRFLNDEPIQARRPSLMARSVRWARRHVAWFVSLTLVFGVAAVAALAANYLTSRERARTATAFEQAEANFDTALKAVDDMYLELATRWIDEATAPSRIQQDFLLRARSFYADVARRPLNTTQDRAQAARVFARIGQIDLFLDNYDAADTAFQRSITLCQQLLNDQPENNRLRSELARQYRRRAETLTKLVDLPRARQAFELGCAQWNQLQAHVELEPEDELERIRIDHGLAKLSLYANELETAQSELESARRQTRLLPQASTIPDVGYAELENKRLSAMILLARGDLSAALDEAQSALFGYRFRRERLFSEDHTTIQLEAQLIDLIGQIAEARGDWAQARQLYLSGLEIQRRNLQSRKEPSQLIVSSSFLGEAGRLESAAFSGYIETQLRLARVLIQIECPYEAENRLGQCQLASYVISADRLDILRYHVAEANTWALLWQVIQTRRPNEAAVVLDYAVQIWHEILARFPNASEFRSGVHGFENDLAWFRGLLDSAHDKQLMDQELWIVPATLRAPPNIAFHRDAAGRSWLDAGQPERALAPLQQSADMREADHAYAWLQLAIAHARLGERNEAESWLNKADREMSRTKAVSPELKELRDAALHEIGRSPIRGPSRHRDNQTK